MQLLADLVERVSTVTDPEGMILDLCRTGGLRTCKPSPKRMVWRRPLEKEQCDEAQDVLKRCRLHGSGREVDTPLAE